MKVSKKQLITRSDNPLMDIMFLFLDLAMSNFSPLYLYTMFFMFLNWLTLSLYIGLYKIGIVHRSLVVNPPLQGESYLEVEPIIESLPFPTQDVQVQEVTSKSLPFPTEDVQVQEVTLEELITKNAHNEAGEEDRYYGKQSNTKGIINPFWSHMTISLYNIRVLLLPLMQSKHLHQYRKLLKDKNWVEAMKEEMKGLEKNSTWKIVDRPKDKKVTYGIDYEETFAPVANMNMVRVALSLAAHFGCNLQQFDVKNTFLHGHLEEEVYMEIPPRFYSHNEKNKVCKLKKALSGLKQSPLSMSQGDHTLSIKHSPNGKLTPLLVYVDDMIVTSDHEIEKLTLKEKLTTQFEMKELGKLKYFLRIEVTYSKQGIFILQRKYVLDLLKETEKLGCKISRVPIEQNNRIRKSSNMEEQDAKCGCSV
ncbi:hypothetical protein CR513_12011, partial [Mucuna pruriens]